jgi:hypothetical protein
MRQPADNTISFTLWAIIIVVGENLFLSSNEKDNMTLDLAHGRLQNKTRIEMSLSGSDCL